jgi:hypothetical protein
MHADPTLTTLDAERGRLARLTRRGLGMPVAGMLYWIAVAILVRRLPPGTALVFAFALTGAVFPAGAGLTRLLGGNLFAKSPSLTPLGLQLAAVQLFYWPVVIVVFREATAWTPFTLAVLFGSHFLPYAWLYRSRGYLVLSLLVALVLSGAALATRSALHLQAPVLAAACYAVAIGLLWSEVRRDAS